ncbi:MAG: calcium-binding protein [Hyphomicrobiales bacterium]
MVFMGLSAVSVTNSGLVAGGSGTACEFLENNGITNDTFTNTGTLLGDIVLGNGTNKLTNSGLISYDTDYGAGLTHANIFFGSGNDTLDNKGVIDGYVSFGGGANKGTNSKAITGKDGNGVSLLFGSGDDTFTNAKGATIAGAVDLANGLNVFTNAGYVGTNGIAESLFGGNSVDTVKNSGTFAADVHLYDGNDVFTNTGQVLGVIDLGDGNDVFKGGNFAETVKDSFGSDTITLGGGNDIFLAFGGEGDGKDGVGGNLASDTVDGGAGIDTYDGSLVPQDAGYGILVNLDGVNHQVVTKGTAGNANSSYIDKIKGFENVTGGDFADVIFGSSGANVIKGNGSFDELYGFGGNDTLDGGDGADTLTGGLGADILTGGFYFDIFSYDSIKDSGLTKATRDTITDFEDTVDTIDLGDIDANTTLANDQGFSNVLLLGNGTFTATGQLRIYQTATGWMIEGEVTGDGKADFSIAVNDLDHSISWDSVDFSL